MPKTEVTKKNFTHSLNAKRMDQLKKWFKKNKPVKYSSFNHFVESAIENEAKLNNI